MASQVRTLLALMVAITASMLHLAATLATEDRGSMIADTVPAVQKVIELLSDMSVKAVQGKHDEEVSYAAFDTWCKQETAQLSSTIQETTDSIESTEAEIEKLETEANALGEEKMDLKNNIANFEADKKTKKVERETALDDFLLSSRDYTESVEAIGRALDVLQKQNYDRSGTQVSLMQVSQMAMVPQEAKTMISSFLAKGLSILDGDDSATEAEGSKAAAPEAHAYEFQSSSIVTVLKGLQDKFKTELAKVQKEEVTAKNAHNLVMASLTSSIDSTQRDIQEKTQERESKLQKSAEGKRRNAGSVNVLVDDKKTLDDVTAECTEKGNTYKDNQSLRAEEIDAIKQAITVLKSQAVAGNAEKHLSLPQQAAARTTLLQIKSQEAAGERNSGVNRQVRDFLFAQGRQLRSQNLRVLSERMAANPFADVTKMVEDMISTLEKEATAESTRQAFCNKEIGMSKVTRTKLTEDIDELTAEIEQGKAFISSLTEEISTLAQEVANLEVMMGNATAMREDEKLKNTETIRDATEANAALQDAWRVLKEFYGLSSSPPAFVQVASVGDNDDLDAAAADLDKMIEATPAPTVPAAIVPAALVAAPAPSAEEAVFTPVPQKPVHKSEVYTGQQGMAGGVLGLIEVIQSDFANLRSQTEAAESTNQKLYQELMDGSRISKATKDKKIELNTLDRNSAQAHLQQSNADLKRTQDQMQAAEAYYAQLVPQCSNQGVTYQERAMARKAEIESLKEALKILSKEDI